MKTALARRGHLTYSLVPLALIGIGLCSAATILRAQVKAKVIVITDKLPIDKQDKMRDFDNVIKRYIEQANWFEDEPIPVELTLQLFLTDSPSNVEDRYNCELLISSSDVQYFDKRIRFPYQPGDVLTYNEHNIDPLTGVIDFYVNLILGNEFDKYSSFGGDFYYRRAKNIAALGKSVRTEFVQGWIVWRDDVADRIFKEPFITFRKAKDYYFYGLDLLPENKTAARKNLRIALDLLETVMEKRSKMEEPEQFFNAHYLEIIEVFKDDPNKKELFGKLIKMDPSHKQAYEEQLSGS